LKPLKSLAHRRSRLHKALTLWRIADDNPLYELREALLNAFILAGLAFFTCLGGVQITVLREDPASALLAAGIAAGIAFFTRLAIERGLRSPK